jgi:serine/threonine-protein phosphatase 6 regulatory ankyrin repeat subunit B
MFAAAYGGAGDQLWRVYQYGSEPNPIENANHPPPLIAALQHPDLQTAELSAATLLANGARPNPSRPAPQTPLHLAAERGSEAIVEMLIRKGAHIDARNEANVTAVEIAERRKYSAVARLLRHHRDIPRDHSTSRTAYDANGEPFRSADLSHHDVLTRSRIVGAAHFRFDEVRETVTRHPELAKAVATTTEAAVEACAHTGARPIVDFLLDHGAPYSLPTAVMRNDAQRVKELLTEDPERIHERGPHDFALLWYPVIAGGSLELAERLIKSGASVEHQHHLGTTALHWAARGGQRDMVAFLIENGADIERVGRKFNPSGETPLQTAIARNHTDIADLLKAKGAKS